MQRGATVIVLLADSDKGSQSRDIQSALELARNIGSSSFSVVGVSVVGSTRLVSIRPKTASGYSTGTGPH